MQALSRLPAPSSDLPSNEQERINEQEWRARYGMPVRSRPGKFLRAVARKQRPQGRIARLFSWRPRNPVKAVRKSGFRLIKTVLKLAALIAFAIWVTGSGAALLQSVPGSEPQVAVPASLTADAAGATRRSDAASYDGFIAKFASVNETSLVALRGYSLTGSDGFRTEWLHATAELDRLIASIDQNSRSWSDGRKLVQLSEVRGNMTTLRNEELMLVGIIGTLNQYPGLRLYREDVDPALVQSLALLDEALQSALASRGPKSAARIDTLATLRGNVREMQQNLLVYLPSGDNVPSERLRLTYAEFHTAPAKLSAMRGDLALPDRERLSKLIVLLTKADAKLQQIFALKGSPRWDYAEYSFKQRIIPLAAKILGIVEEWKTAS